MKDRILKLTALSASFTPAPLLAASEQCNGVSAVGGSCNAGDLTKSIGSIINTIFIVIGTLAVLILLVGAIRYITSTGDAKRIQQAKDTILYAVIGLVVAILSYSIVGFIIGKIS